jgi:hypothetical protein
MRVIARIAIARGYKQESLAKALAQRPGLSGIQAANVKRHFQSLQPRKDTVADYAAVLDISEDQLYVLKHRHLPEDREKSWERFFFRTLALFETEFEPGAPAAVKQAFHDSAIRSRVLAAMALPPNPIPTEWSAIPSSLIAAAVALFPAVDLRDFLCEGNPMLFKIYLDALAFFSPEKAQAYVRACSAILELEGIDTEPMLNYIRKRCSISEDGLHTVTTTDGTSRIVKSHGDDSRAAFAAFAAPVMSF